MFGLGMGELLVILVLALLFLGPKRLPDVATSLGKAIRSFRKAASELGNQLEIDDSLKQPMRELRAAINDEPAQANIAHAASEVKVAARASLAARRPVAAAAPSDEAVPPPSLPGKDEPPRGA